MSKKTNNGKRFAAIACAALVGVSGLGIGGTSVEAAEVGKTVSEAGAMNYVDMSKYTQVLLPTSSTMSFALDPQGLSTITGTSADAKDLAAAAGNIVSNGEVSVANYGYYPIKVRANFYVTDNGASTFVNNAADVEADTSKKVYLTVTPSSTKTTVTDDGTAITGTAGYTAASESLSITGKAVADAQCMVYALSGAEYEFTKTDGDDGKVTYAAQRKSGGDYGAAAFKIGGKINKNADWAAYTGATPKTLKLNAVFSYSTMTNDEYAYLTKADGGFVKSGTYNQVMDTAPEISATEVKLDPNKGGTLPLSLGTGATASTVKSVQLIRRVTKLKLSDSSPVAIPDTKTVVKGFTTNATGTALNIPAIAELKTFSSKVNKENVGLYDPDKGEYLKIYYTDATYSFEVDFSLVVTLADGTVSDEIPITVIDAVSPSVQYTGAALAKKTTATANAVINPTDIKVNLGNCGATEVTKVEINESKTTTNVSAINAALLGNAITNKTDITIKAQAFKYLSGADPTVIVFTVTFDSGETAEFEVPVL